MPAPNEIVALVGRYDANRDQYHSPSFSEVAVRHQFIDPLFAGPD